VLLLLLVGVAVLVVRLLSWAMAVEIAPVLGANSKRISLVADIALIFDPTSAGPARCSFYCSRPGRGANPVACPLQKNQLAAPPPSCRYFAGAVTSCSYCGICLLLLLCHLESSCRASFWKSLYISGLRIWWVGAGKKKPGQRYRCSRFLLRVMARR